MPDLRLTCLVRKTPLTDAETDQLGYLLTHYLGIYEVSFPDDKKPSVIAHGHSYNLPPGLVPKVAEVLGDFEEDVE